MVKKQADITSHFGDWLSFFVGVAGLIAVGLKLFPALGTGQVGFSSWKYGIEVRGTPAILLWSSIGVGCAVLAVSGWIGLRKERSLDG